MNLYNNPIIKLSGKGLSRKYLDDGTLPTDLKLRISPFYSHSFVDSLAANTSTNVTNKSLMESYLKKNRIMTR